MRRGGPSPSSATRVRAAAVGLVLSGVAACAGSGIPGTATGDTEVPAPVVTAPAPESTTTSSSEVAAPATVRPPASTSQTSSPPSDVPTSPLPVPEDPSCPSNPELFAAPDEPVRVILDTDFAADVDDVGALAVLHALADAGEVEILGIMVSDGGDAPSDRAIDAINTFYGRPDIPIGVVSGAAPRFSSSYVGPLATEFPNDVENPPAAVDLYRDILAGEPDGSVTIVSIGYLTNLDALLSSPPDASSDRSGVELVAAKVRRWVAMGGTYPDSVIHPLGAEFNFAEDATASLNAIGGWPTRALFSGWEVGDVVLTGAALQSRTPAGNPVREAYRLFNGGQDRQSWDLTAVLIAVRGDAGVFEACAGVNVVGRGGSNTWRLRADGPHGFVRLVAPPEDVAALLDDLMTEPPAAS